MAEARAVVASDLEGTLTTGATWKGVGRYLRAHGQGFSYHLLFARFLPAFLLAKAGVLDEQILKDLWIERMAMLLRGWTEATVGQMAEWVVEHELWPNRRPAVVAELEAHRDAGRRVVLTSGTYLPVIAAFAGRIGAEAIGSPLTVQDGRLTGRLAGTVNTGESKAQQLAAYAQGAPLYAAYGDTAADVPMLALSESPVSVHPDRELRQVAESKGWRILMAAP